MKTMTMSLNTESAKTVKKAMQNALDGKSDKYTPWLEKNELVVTRNGEIHVTGVGRLIIDRYLNVKDVRNLWKIQGDSKNFIRSKSSQGISSYTFLELCHYRGYIPAFRQAYGFSYSTTKYSSCTLALSFMRIHYDCVQMRIEIEGHENVELTARRDGVILLEDGTPSDLHYREWEATVLARMKLNTSKKFIKNLLKDGKIKGLPRLTPKADQGEPEKRE